jgi:hypothetical protein
MEPSRFYHTSPQKSAGPRGGIRARIDGRHHVDAQYGGLRQSGADQGLLIGRICDLSGFTSDGWRRRELNVKQGARGYPEVRDTIDLIDTDGKRYRGLPFVKGARHSGHACLGQPGSLKPWFVRHYDFKHVATEDVYLTSIGQPNEYRIYTHAEWAALNG